MKKGFTLIELMVVLAIIGIITAIAVPGFTGYIRKTQVRDIVREAKLNEDTCMQIAGMQYSYAGNPYIGRPDPENPDRRYSGDTAGWSFSDSMSMAKAQKPYVLDEATYKKQYFYLDSAQFTSDPIAKLMRGSLANSYSTLKTRDSEGIREYRQRTGLPFAPATFLKSYGDCTTWLWFKRPSVSELKSMSSASSSYYFHYDLVFSEYWFTKDGKNFGVFHNFKFDDTTETQGHPDVREKAKITPGWFVYEFKEDGNWYYYGEQGG